MDCEKLLEKFYQACPELRNAVEKKFKEGRLELSDGDMIVWVVGIMDCVMPLFANVSQNSNTLDSVFAVIEWIALETKNTTREILISTFTCFLNEEQVIPEALSRMGPETRKFWDEYMEYLRQFRLWKLSQL